MIFSPLIRFRSPFGKTFGHRPLLAASRQLIALSLAVGGIPLAATAAGNVLTVDPVDGIDDGTSPFATIGAAVTAADSGDLIDVMAGTYLFSSSLVLNQPMTLRGPNAGLNPTAGGARVAEAVLDGGTVDGLLQVRSGKVIIEGFSITSNAGSGVSVSGMDGIKGLVIRNNIFDGNSEAFLSTAADAEDPNLIEDLWFGDNLVRNNVGTAFSHSTGIKGENFTLQGNEVSGALAGFALRNIDQTVLTGNKIRLGNSEYAGIFLTGEVREVTISQSYFSDSGAGVVLAEINLSGPLQIEANVFQVSTGYGIEIRDDSSGPTDVSWIMVEENEFTGNGLAAISNEAAGTVRAEKNYWGHPVGPVSGGDSVSGDVAFSPWYADAARTHLIYGILQDWNVPSGEAFGQENIYIAPGIAVTVAGTLAATGELVLAEGAVLEVVNGDLALGDGSVLSGTFTFFNSLGSINFNDDVSIAGSASGLILISDVHVADEATITVDGTLVIDGSVIDSDGRFNLVVNDTADFTMARTTFVNGDMVVGSGDVKIYDNRFESSTIEVTVQANGAAIYHNLTDDLGWLTDGGTNSVTTVDGWGNVTDVSETANRIRLDFDGNLLLPGRTLDSSGNVYIQPADTLYSRVDVSALQAKIAGVEVLLGYSTDFFSASSIGLEDDWDLLITSVEDDSTVIGKLDAAIGLSFDFSDPAGTAADQTIADVELSGQGLEGQTLFFHRVKLAMDAFGGETRLTTGGAAPAYLTPFTANSAVITIDGTAPSIADVNLYSSVEQFGAEMTGGSATTIQGALDIVAAAFDALAGIEDASAVVTLVGTTTTYTATQTGTGLRDIGGVDYTEYTFVYEVVPATLNGLYDVVFTVTDRSGNESSTSLGEVAINKNEVELAVQLQGLVAGPITRDVVFVFTDVDGNPVDTRQVSVEFTSAVGSVVFTDVDVDSFRLSAKTDWNLRKRLDIGFNSDGQAVMAFTGADLLVGGDLNGDNTIGTIDYGILRFYFFQSGGAALQADITGSGAVGTIDYGILRNNFFVAGDPL